VTSRSTAESDAFSVSVVVAAESAPFQYPPVSIASPTAFGPPNRRWTRRLDRPSTPRPPSRLESADSRPGASSSPPAKTTSGFAAGAYTVISRPFSEYIVSASVTMSASVRRSR
jgi:hypothetical protein